MYTLCKKTLTVSCTLLCESGDRVMVDQSSFSADLQAVMLRHHCSEYALNLMAIKCQTGRHFTGNFFISNNLVSMRTFWTVQKQINGHPGTEVDLSDLMSEASETVIKQKQID